MTTPQPRLPGDAREDHAAAAGAIIGALYAQAELVIIAAIAHLARRAVLGGMNPRSAVTRLRQTVAATFSRLRASVEAELSRAAVEIAPQLTAQGVPALTPAEAVAALDSSGLPEAIAQAESTAAQSAEDALTEVVTAAQEAGGEPPLPPRLRTGGEDIYRSAVRRAIESTRGGAPYSSLSLSRIQAAQKALDDLTSQGVTGFTDRAGRNWDLASYVEMATRTAVSNSWDELQAGAASRAGFDLALIYTHSTEGSCPRCLPWLGKTVSITGATPGFPSLRGAKAAGFRHPNCRCSWLIVGAGIAEEVTSPVPLARAAEAYKASQRQRALERGVRAAARRAQGAITPAARGKARRELAHARGLSAQHRARHGVVQTKVGAKRREHPSHAR